VRVDVELQDLLDLLADLASDAKDQARIDFAGTKADAVIIGISFLIEHIRISLQDTEEFDLSPETEAQTLQKAISNYCRKWCDQSKDKEPGMDDRCPSCPLMPFTVGAAEHAVNRALGAAPEPAPQPRAPRHGGGFDPEQVAAARRRLEQSIRDGDE